MKKIILPLLMLVTLLFSGCGDDEPQDAIKEISMSVSSETGITYDLFDTNREHPIECLLVMSEDDPGKWVPLGMHSIEGFVYERGHEYELRVKRTILANLPADGSDRTYSLVYILSDRIVEDPEITPDKEIRSEEDIEYYDRCPFNKYGILKEYIVNKDGGISYANGRPLPSYNSARIYVNNIMDKADPDWLKFQKVPYMATYAYVLSPFTDEIRLVRNESGGMLFKKVIPEKEFAHIKQTMKPGDELHYSVILANVYKKGLQKLTFTIKKQ
ncbi:MAG: DUF4377 domain-containing protein [Prevotella sp.]|jgi:hypothetical protein